jgi:Acyl-CoA dehydrogenase, N-terminal domain
MESSDPVRPGVDGSTLDGSIRRRTVHMELNRGDGRLGMIHAVLAGLAMRSIWLLGSEEQKNRWLPGMARLDLLGAFVLTEPGHGSDAVALETRPDGTATATVSTARSAGSATARSPITDRDVRYVGDRPVPDVRSTGVRPPSPRTDGDARLR